MGFTRYFDLNTDLKMLPIEFRDDATAIIRAADDLGIEIAGWDGVVAPEVSVMRVRINGADNSANGGDDLSYEDFSLDLKPTPGALDPFPFCKTAREPYDVVVGAILRSAKFHNVVTSYGSDGGNEEDAITALLAVAGCAERAA